MEEKNAVFWLIFAFRAVWCGLCRCTRVDFALYLGCFFALGLIVSFVVGFFSSPDLPLLAGGPMRERDPRSDTVKIKVIVDAHRQAHVVWGRKDFGVAPLEIERPRNSGPLDLVVVAPGYLPLHARALTDRDDVLSLRIYSAAEAPQLLGYRPEAAAAPESGSATSPVSPRNKGENARPRMGSPATVGKTGDEKILPPNRRR